MRSHKADTNVEQGFAIISDAARLFDFDERGFPLPLKPTTVYYAIAGIFADNEKQYKLMYAVFCNSESHPNGQEYARIYQEVNSDQLHILFYPGKDNDSPVTEANPTKPLSHIKSEVELIIIKVLGQDQYLNAKKYFTICASNTYYWFFPIRHYINGFIDNKCLVTEDSTTLNYNESYVDNQFPHEQRVKIKRGYQNTWYDKSSCGNYNIAAAERYIKNKTEAPFRLTITWEMLQEHQRFYELGIHTNANQILSASDLEPDKTEIDENSVLIDWELAEYDSSEPVESTIMPTKTYHGYWPFFHYQFFTTATKKAESTDSANCVSHSLKNSNSQ